MHNQQPTHNKTTGSTEDKPVTTEITVNDEPHIIDATHHIISDAGVVSLYLGARSEGIDIQIINGTVLCRSDRARDRLNMHVNSGTQTDENEHTGTHADEKRLVTDGGRPRRIVVHCEYCTAGMSVKPDKDKPQNGWKCKQCRRAAKRGDYSRKALAIIENADVEPGDRVEYNGREWVFVDYFVDHAVTLVPVGLVPREETVKRAVDVRDLDPVEPDDDPYDEYDPVTDGRDESNDQELVADGGQDEITIVEGQPDPDKAVNIGLMFDGDDWCVTFESLTDWSQNDLEPWLENRLDAPGTIDEAKSDDRIFAPRKEYGQEDIRDVSFHDSTLARGAFNDESNTWTVEVL